MRIVEGWSPYEVFADRFSPWVDEVDESNAAAVHEADFSTQRDRFVRLIDALKRFQNRNISPLERFTRFDGAITSEADVLQFVLEECEPPIHR